ncbi:CmNV_049-like protein [Aratus pisonii nudivirus]|nr:CmNV_049-like protein [Aratus pisonii nudivirus]
MNILDDNTNLLRTHYYIYKYPVENNISYPLYIQNSKVYVTKNLRGFDSQKFTHVDFLSYFRVLGFNYMNFKCENLTELIMRAKSHLLDSTVEIREVETHNSLRYCTTTDGFIKQGAYIYHEESDALDISINELTELRDVWPYGAPIIKQVTVSSRFNFDYQNSHIDFCHFIEFINNYFNSNVSSVFQNPIRVIYDELNYKYNTYKVFNNIQQFGFDLFPRLFDYLVTESIFETCQRLTK